MVTRFIQLVLLAIVITLVNYATASPFDFRTLSQCSGTVPGMKDVKNAFKQDAQFCNFWLAAKRINSPIPDVQPAAISSACKCIAATATPTPKTIIAPTPKPTACATKKDPYYSAALSDIANPKAFCQFWFLDPHRFRTVVPGVGPQHLSSICSCITTSPKASSSTSHSTVTSTTVAHTTASSTHTTTTAAPAASSTSSSASQTATSSSTDTSQSSSTSSTSSSSSTSASVSQNGASSSSSSASADASSSSSSSSTLSATTSSTTQSASPTPKSDAAICPALSGDTLVDTSGTSYAMQCDRTYAGTVITGGSRKRQAEYTIENCLTACNGVTDCVAVSVLNGACTMLSDVNGYSSQSGAAAALNEVRAQAAGISESAIPSIDPPASSTSSTLSETTTSTSTSAASDGDSAATASSSTASSESTATADDSTTSTATASGAASSSAPSLGDGNNDTSDSTTSTTASASITSTPSAGGSDTDSADTTTASSSSRTESSTATVSESAESTESSSPTNGDDTSTETQSSPAGSSSSTASGESTATVSSSPESTESSTPSGDDGSSTESQSTVSNASSSTATDGSTATVSDSSQQTESSSPPADSGSSTSTQSAPADSAATSTSSASTTSTNAATSTSSTPSAVNAFGCTAPTAGVISGLPAAACGANFDQNLNDVLGYYSSDSADLTEVEAAIIPGLPTVGNQKRALTETIQTVAKDAISTILAAAQSAANAIVAALPGDVQNAEAAVADVSSSVAYRAASQTLALKRNLDSVHKPGTQWSFARRAADVPAQGFYASGLNTGSPAASSTISSSSSGTAPFSTSSFNALSTGFSMVVTGTAPTSVANATFFPTGTAPTQAFNSTTTSPAATASVGTISRLPINQTTSAMVGTGTAVLPTSFAPNNTSLLTSLSSALGTAPTLTPSSNQTSAFPTAGTATSRPNTNQTVPLSTGAIIPSTTFIASTGFATVSRAANATSDAASSTSSETFSVPLGTAPVSTPTIAGNHSIVLSTGATGTSSIPSSTLAANHTVVLSTGGLLVSTTSTIALSTGVSSGLPTTTALANNATAPSTTLTSTTTSASSSVPTPSSNATAPATDKVNSAPISITDTTKTLQLQPGSDGSLFVSTNNADVSSLSSSTFVWDQTNDVVFGDSSSRLLHYFPSELTALGASRVRLAGWGDIPVGASLLNLVPFQTNAASNPVLVAVDSLGKYVWPFVCGLQGQTNKVFLVDDLANGASILEGSDLVYTIVGGVAQNCAPLALTGDGMTGINV